MLQRPDVRLVTLTGSAGVGKTRLALRVAEQLGEVFADGVHFISLAALVDPELLLPTIAQALGVRESGAHSFLSLLEACLRERSLLLILDNVEQILTAASQIADVLAGCPRLKVLVTSREVLHLRVEQQFVVPPLALPPGAAARSMPDLQALAHNPSMRLFLQRAQAAQPAFHLTPSNAATLVDVCLRLEGLPLAIELAAPRVKLLSLQALLARLEHRLEVLTQGSLDLPSRQQTLRKTVQWSYDLLTPHEQQLFQRLAVFVGGCTLEAAEAMTRTGSMAPTTMLETATSLLDKSLVQRVEQEDGEIRLTMLETLREFGLERLDASGDTLAVHRAHAEYMLALAEQAEPHLSDVRQAVWLGRLDREQGNIRAALRWFLEHDEIESVLRLGGALSSFTSFWEIRGYLTEGRAWLKQALARGDAATASVRAKAWYGAGMLASSQGNFDGAEAELQEGLRLFEETAEQRGIAYSLGGLGNVAERKGDTARAYHLYRESNALFTELHDAQGICETLILLAKHSTLRGDLVRAHTLCEESLASAKAAGDTLKTAVSLLTWAIVSFYQEDLQAARLRAEHSLALFKELGHRVHIAYAQTYLGRITTIQGDYAAARPFLLQAVELLREIDSKRLLTIALGVLGYLYYVQGDYEAAWPPWEEDLALSIEVDDKEELAYAMENLASLMAVRSQPVDAAHLYGLVQALRQTINVPLPPVELPIYERRLAVIRSQIGAKRMAAALAEGHRMTFDQAMRAVAQAMSRPSVSATLPSKLGPSG